ncbi:MAG: L-fucose:H+ symporter permease [Verrucomicrobiota bacterium]|jgi:FHS family L-fucose permease-like MFS transporter
MSTPESSSKHFLPLALVTTLFCCSGLTHNLLPVLIPKLKAACELSNTQSMYVDVAQWMAYFLMAFPAALIMRRFGYRAGIIAGLLVAACGFLLFIPAAHAAAFSHFLLAFFISASGLVFLETAANPYISVLGNPARAAFRLNVAQSFYGLAAVISSLWIAKIIIKPENEASLIALLPADKKAEVVAKVAALPAHEQVDFLLAQLKALAPAAHHQHLLDQALMVIPPYLCIACAMILLAGVFCLIKLPEIKIPADPAAGPFKILAHPLLIWGIVAQFFYVGAQVGVDATFLSYTRQMTGLSLYDATTYLGLILGCFFLGRVAGTSLMAKLSPAAILGAYALACGSLLAACALVPAQAAASQTAVAIPSWLHLGEQLVFTSHPAPYLVMGVKFFMSIMYPTIFSLAIRGLGEHTKTASSLLVMSIVGGAFLPLAMGSVADACGGQFQPGYWLPCACMLPVLAFALIARRQEAAEKSAE